jgi:hypothetical protein
VRWGSRGPGTNTEFPSSLQTASRGILIFRPVVSVTVMVSI